ncbi:MAG: HU family DNA-binding protein [Deltaproteobacteria bacterium]|jgi:nucleoid DNA-binding protein|nr:HU family DNA-binding protein [Deltaproteobacteria bacterium]
MAKPILGRADLVQLAREALSVSARDGAEILDALLDVIVEALDQGQEVRIPNLGRLSVRVAPARQGRNPKTGAKKLIPAQRRAVFAPSQNLRKRLAANMEAATQAASPAKAAEPAVAPLKPPKA